MTDIALTQAAVRNLATLLARGDTDKMKHTERLALIAGAFGWRADALMHALKQNQAVSNLKTSVPTAQAEFTSSRRTRIQLDEVLKRLTLSPGLFLVAGPKGSGKSTTLKQLSHDLGELGYRPSPIVGPRGDKAKSEKLFHIFDDIEEPRQTEEACLLAEGGEIVLASTETPSILPVAFPEDKTRFYRQLRGVIAQRFLNRQCSRCIASAKYCETCAAGEHGSGAMVAEVVNLDYAKQPFDYRAFAKTDARFIPDAIEAVRQGRIDIRAVERVLGVKAVTRFLKENQSRFAFKTQKDRSLFDVS
jgi:hypothetical protein